MYQSSTCSESIHASLILAIYVLQNISGHNCTNEHVPSTIARLWHTPEKVSHSSWNREAPSHDRFIIDFMGHYVTYSHQPIPTNANDRRSRHALLTLHNKYNILYSQRWSCSDLHNCGSFNSKKNQNICYSKPQK